MNQRESKAGRPLVNRVSEMSKQQEHRVPQQHPLEGIYANPTMTHTLTTLVGCVVDVHLQSGLIYEGILRTVSPQLDVALEVAHIKGKDTLYFFHPTFILQLPSRESVEKTIELKFADIVSVSVNEDSSISGSDIFKTDVEIGRTNGPNATRELQPFMDFGDESSLVDLDSAGQGWSVNEMWSVNQDTFQVRSSYDEEMTQYTTQLVRGDTEEFKEREARAAKLAGEIEKKGRHTLDDAGTEEELFSAVIRPEVTAPLSSLPPEMEGSVTETSTPVVQSNGSIPGSSKQSAIDPQTGGEVATTGSGSMGDGCEEGGKETSDQDKPSEAQEGEQRPSKDEGDQPGQSAESPKQDVVVEVEKKEAAIRKFKLDPNAKEFNPGFSASVFIPISPATTQASPSPPVTSSSLRSSPSTITPHHPPTTSGNPRRSYNHRNTRHTRTHTPTHTLIQPDPIMMTSPATSGYVLSAGQPAVVSTGHIRPGQVYPGIPQYTSVPAGSGFIGQGVISAPQGVSSPKYMEVPSPHQLLGQQLMHQQQLLTQGQGHLLPTATQAQMMAQGLITPQQQQLIAAAAAAGIQLQPTMAVQPGFIPGQPMAGMPQNINRIVTYQHPASK